MSALTRDQILGAELPREEVPTPEWGGSVYVRTIPTDDRLKLEQAMEANRDTPFPAVILAFALCDETGKPLFTGDDIALLAKQDPRPMIRAARRAAKLNQITAADLDELEKN